MVKVCKISAVSVYNGCKFVVRHPGSASIISKTIPLIEKKGCAGMSLFKTVDRHQPLATEYIFFSPW
jgi:hypothetical protein